MGFKAAAESWSKPDGNDPNCPTRHTESYLCRRLEESIVAGQPGHTEFIPIDVFEDVLCLDSITKLQNDCPGNWKVAQIYRSPERSRKRLLGILILMKRIHHIVQFVQKDIWDHDLASGLEPSSCIAPILEKWNRNDVTLFRANWKSFFVPFFDFQHRRTPSYVLHDTIALPWIEYGEGTLGGFSTVRRVRIHRSHHNFNPNNVCGPSSNRTWIALWQ